MAPYWGASFAYMGAGVLGFEADIGAAWDFGGGAMFFFGTNVVLRTDLRYVRTFGRVALDISDGIVRRGRLDFARASAGLIVRF